MFKYIFAVSFLTITAAFGATTAMAASGPNLSVLAWQGSSTPLVESPYQYTSRVQNIGNKTANGVVMTIEFPLTSTSPNKYILGKLSAITPGSGTCSIVSNKIVCNFGNIARNETRQVTFTFEFQVATTLPTITSSVTTTSNNEQVPANNTRATTPAIRYPDNVMTSGTYVVSSCTGTNLTSFYECEVSPGSIQTLLSLEFNLGGTLSVTGYPMYTGLWDQYTLQNKSLHFTIPGELDFNGFASNGACFKGITTFPQNSNYKSAYRVCEQ